MSKRKLDISNYEEWMLDRMEGRLDPKESAELEEFLHSHPELEEDLDLLSDVSLSPFDLKHPDKESLKMPEARDLRILSALESGSDGSEFAEENLKEFKRYQKTILIADERITFPNKESLKKEESTPIIPMWLTRVAIAASLIGIVLTVFFQTRPDVYEPRLSDTDLPSLEFDFPDESQNNLAETTDGPTPQDSEPISNQIINELAQEDEIQPSNEVPVPLYERPEDVILAQEPDEAPDEINESPDLDIAQIPEIIEENPSIDDEPLIAELPEVDPTEVDPQVAEVPEVTPENPQAEQASNTQRFGSVLDVLKHATKDTDLLALENVKEESAYVETSLKVGRFQLAVKRKNRN